MSCRQLLEAARLQRRLRGWLLLSSSCTVRQRTVPCTTLSVLRQTSPVLEATHFNCYCCRQLEEAAAQAAAASERVAALEQQLGAQTQSAAERQKRFTLLNGTFKRKVVL